MLECDRDEQWTEALGLWVDRKVVAYLKENHSRFEEILGEQSELAEKYPAIVPFLNEEGDIELTAEEHKAVMEYLNLRESTELLIREYHYYLGQAMNIPGLQEFGIYGKGEAKTGEERTNQLLDLLAENQIEEAEQMLRSANPEYRKKVDAVSEAQKAVCNLQTAEDVKNVIGSYVDAVNCRWLMFSKLLYRYAVEDILCSSRKPKGQRQHEF